MRNALRMRKGGLSARRTDELLPAELGSEIDSHNLVFTINSATLQVTTLGQTTIHLFDPVVTFFTGR